VSEYLRLLNRLERDKPSRAVPPARLAAPVPTPTPRPPRPVPAPAAATSAAHFAALYDSLRATANGEAVRSFVFASADADGSPRVIIDGLAAHVRRLGHRVCIAEVVESDRLPLLRVHVDGTPIGGRAQNDAMPLDLRSHAGADEVREWLRQSTHADLTLIDAGGLEQSIDPALLACGCDGLLIVVRAERTRRETLRLAVERARSVGCRILGLVMEVQPSRLPPWQRRRSRTA
jgi:hypothetical protein